MAMNDIIKSLPGGKRYVTGRDSSKEFRIAMLGPRRAGKTSVLAAMYERFQNTAAASGLRLAADQASDQGGSTEVKLKALHADLRKVVRESHSNKRGTGGYSPSIAGSDTENRYKFYLSRRDIDPTTNPELTIQFCDYPGSWLSDSGEDYEKVLGFVKESHAAVLAVDAPYLMEDGMRFHSERNLPGRIVNLLRQVYEEREDPHLLILVPVRCEKYTRTASGREVLKDSLITGYTELLQMCAGANLRQRVRIVVSPVETTGCIEFSGWRRDPSGGIPGPTFFLTEPDALWAPKDSDQPLRHILGLAVNRLVNAKEDGPWGAVMKHFFEDNTPLHAAIESFSSGIKTTNGFGVLQPGAYR